MRMYQKKIKSLLLVFFSIVVLSPQVTLALTDIGGACSDNSDCTTTYCKDSALENVSNDDFCVCKTAVHCSDKYSGDPSDWKCTDEDDDVFYDLDYCVKLSTNKAEDPLAGNSDQAVKDAIKKIGAPGVKDAITDSEGSVQQFHNEIGDLLKTPQPKITIPGLNFSEIDIKSMVTKDPSGNTWLNIPFLGEYLSVVYRYSVIAVSILAVIAIINVGIIWTIRGGGSEGKQEAQKKLAMAFIGLLIASISYALLYTINPELVNFRSLKVLYVKEEGVIHDPSADSNTFDDIKPPPCKGPNDPSKFAGFGVDNTGPMDEYACGTRDLNKVRFLVLHEGGRNNTTAGILIKRHLSTHYIIKRDGTVLQTAGLEKRARHAGAINAESIGVDIEIASGCSTAYKCSKDPSCVANCVYTPAQYESIGKLIDFVSARTAISRSDARIIGHCQVSGTTHGDPRNFDWKSLGFDPCKHRKDCGKSGVGACIKSWGKGNAYAGEVEDDSNPEGCCVISEEGIVVKAPKKKKDCEAMSNFVDFEEMSCPLQKTDDKIEASEGGEFEMPFSP
ncbi:N-acetylmuramoyl-L-alanine amidase [Candidatus Parcubacteria bacterium]|nr:N-acetylmuramoyl-L-alanine amidase [Candidatus Parcubacteria bacterium]MBT3949087.1 N-acetylmuramoyl-L-alanine amidase [Candidatus Parcubacteria bacterium]